MGKRKVSVVVWLNTHGKIKLAVVAVLLGLITYLLTYQLPATQTWTYWTMPLSGRVVAIDAGHGGPDGGAVSKDGVVEKDIALAISRHLRDYLQQAGAIVVMTREGDRDLASAGERSLSKRKTEDLLKRVELIERSNADMLVSIHLNSIPSPKWRGAQTFYYPSNEEGKKLAGFIQQEVKSNLKNTDREPNTEEQFYLLKTLRIPAVLVEVGFLSNPEEARHLADPNYQKKMAEAIYRGILRYASGE
jgi:N-acetylmuramoyl-L-alanine amidase